MVCGRFMRRSERYAVLLTSEIVIFQPQSGGLARTRPQKMRAVPPDPEITEADECPHLV